MPPSSDTLDDGAVPLVAGVSQTEGILGRTMTFATVSRVPRQSGAAVSRAAVLRSRIATRYPVWVQQDLFGTRALAEVDIPRSAMGEGSVRRLGLLLALHDSLHLQAEEMLLVAAERHNLPLMADGLPEDAVPAELIVEVAVDWDREVADLMSTVKGSPAKGSVESPSILGAVDEGG